MRRASLLAMATLAVTLGGWTASAGALTPAWLTYHHDSLRSGIDPDSSSPVAPSQAWQSDPLDGDVYAEPLLDGSLVYVVTENDSVYALNAATGAIVWHASAGTAVPASKILPCNDILPEVGVTSTPVIDPSTNRLYVVAESWDGSTITSIRHQLVSFDLDTGQASMPVAVDPPGSDPVQQLQRPGLALDGHELVVGFGGNSGDCGTYHGWLVGINEDGSNAAHPNVFESTSRTGDGGGSFWGGGNAPPVDSAGNVYAATANGWLGTVDNPPLQFDYSESVLKFGPGLGTPLDYWAPTNWSTLDSNDQDLGSSMPLPLPNGLVLQAGKDQNVYLLHQDALGHISAPAAHLDNICYGAVFGSGVYYAGTAYLACYAGMIAVSVDTNTPAVTARPGWSPPATAIGPPIYAGGLVWSTGYNNGVLYGLDPQTGAPRYQQSYGTFMHFATPSAGGGKLFFAATDSLGNPRVTALTIANYQPNVVPPPRLTLTRVRLSRRRFRARRGTTLRLTLSGNATVSVTVKRRFHGRRVKGRCKSGAKHGKRCTGAHAVQRLRFTGRKGVNTFKLHLKRLPPGRYTAVVSASAINGSVAQTLTFTITKR